MDQDPNVARVIRDAERLMRSIRVLAKGLPEGVNMHVHVNVSDFEPGVALMLSAPNGSPAAMDWLQKQVPDAEARGPYGNGQKHVEAKLSAELRVTAYQTPKNKGSRKR